MGSVKNLKPCPFCGDKPKMAVGDNRRLFKVQCVNGGCFLTVCTWDSRPRGEAIRRWNTRARSMVSPCP